MHRDGDAAINLIFHIDNTLVLASNALPDSCPPFEVNVEDIGFSQDSIAGSLGNGRNVQAAVKQLRNLINEERRKFLAELDAPIRVVHFPTFQLPYITLDNRRLWMFRELLKPGTPVTVRMATMEEAKELRRKLAVSNGGATIAVRANWTSR